MALDSMNYLYVIARGSAGGEWSGPGSFSRRYDVDHVDPGRNNHVHGDVTISSVLE